MKYAPAILIGLSFSPLALVHLRNLGMDERYQHFPLVLGAVGVLLWTRWSQREVCRTQYSVAVSLAMLIAGAGCAVASVVLLSPWLAFAAACMVSASFLLDWHGRSAYRFLPVMLLLLLLLPLPMQMDDALIVKLQDISSRAASLLLDFFGVRHLLSGHIIEVPGAKFMVEEACSGVRSLFAMIALAAIFVVYERRGIVCGGLLIAGAFCWSGAMNVLRIVTVVLSQLMLGVDVAHGWRHDLLGLVTFVLGMAMLFSTDQLLLFLFESPIARSDRPSTPKQSSDAANESQTEPVPGGLRIAASWSIAAAAVIFVGLPSTAVAGIELLQYGQAGRQLTSDMVSQQALPTRIAGWEQISFQQGTQSNDPTHGPQWAAWQYRKGGLIAVVSLDFPFYSWHNLTVCYEGAGWTVGAWESRSMSDGATGGSADAVRFMLEKPGAERGVVFFNHFDTTGQMLPAPSTKEPSFSDWLTNLKLRLARRTHQLGLGRPNFQLQVMASGTAEEVQAAEPDLQRLFGESFAKLSPIVSEGSRGMRK
jgi:exosortase